MLSISQARLSQMRIDLGINRYQEKGREIPVKRCWHYSSDGHAVSQLFYDDTDFTDGMNRVFIVLQKYDVIILAFVLMDNHIHFILYGEREECDRFIREYLRRTAMSISDRHNEPHPLSGLPVSCQKINSQSYLKTAICYVLKNPTSAGMPFNFYDYPWSSGALYFRRQAEVSWCSPSWLVGLEDCSYGEMAFREKREWLKTHDEIPETIGTHGKLVFPGEYVATVIVEELFRTTRNFSYHIGKSNEETEMKSDSLALLTIPWKELRSHRDELCMEMYNVDSFRSLDTGRRLKLGKRIRSQYGCSKKQVAKPVGLVYEEIVDLL